MTVLSDGALPKKPIAKRIRESELAATIPIPIPTPMEN